jgi:hypothetical protein
LTIQPPDLSRPYNTETERVVARETLLTYWQVVELLMKLVQQPADQWSPEQISLFPPSVPGGPPEHPEQRLERWFSLYNDEINILRDIRNAVVHGVPVADSELRGALYLARITISTALGVSPSRAEREAHKLLDALVSRRGSKSGQ